MSGFSNPIIGGGGGLVYPSIHSPDFNEATKTGWSIDKNGNAFFYGITTSGEFTGTTFIINSAGAFFYSGPPAHGNLIASIASVSGADQFGNAYVAGEAVYNPATGQAAALNAGTLSFSTPTSVTPAQLLAGLSGGGANLAISSGTESGSVAGGILNLEDGTALGGAPLAIWNGALNLNDSIEFLMPSGDTTGAHDTLNIDNALSILGASVVLGAGTWYLNGTGLGAGQSISGVGPQTVIKAGSAITATSVFGAIGNGAVIANMTASLGAAAFIDWANANTTNITLSNITWTCTPPSGAGSGAPFITGLNLHRSLIDNCVLNQHDQSTPILTLGTSGTGLSVTTFRACRFVAFCGPGTGGIADNRTVPAINIVVPGNKNLDGVHFEDCWFDNAMNGTNLDNSQYFAYFACSEGGANHDEDRVYFTNVSGNQTLGGLIQLQSIVGAVFDKVSVGNVFSVVTPSGTKQTTASFINVGTFAGGQHSQAISIRDYEREGTANLTSGANPSDIQISSDTVDVLIENPHVPDSGGNAQIDWGGCTDGNLLTANSNIVFVNPPGSGSYNFGGVLTLWEASGGVGFTVNGGNGQVTTAAGFAQNISGSKTSSVSTASVTSTAQASLGFRSIPDGDVVAGGAHLIKASGTFTFGATPPSSATFGVYWGGLAGTQIATLAIPAADMPAGAISQAGWWVQAEVEWVSTTESEVTLKVGWHSGNGVAAGVTLFAVITTTGLTTTAAENLSLAFQWGSAPASTQLATDVCRIGRVA